MAGGKCCLNNCKYWMELRKLLYFLQLFIVLLLGSGVEVPKRFTGFL